MFSDLESAYMLLQSAQYNYSCSDVKAFYHVHDIHTYKTDNALDNIVCIYCDYIDYSNNINTAELFFMIEHCDVTTSVNQNRANYHAVEVRYIGKLSHS